MYVTLQLKNFQAIMVDTDQRIISGSSQIAGLLADSYIPPTSSVNLQFCLVSRPKRIFTFPFLLSALLSALFYAGLTTT